MRKLYPIFLVLFLTGCQGMAVDTANKRFLVVEASLEEVQRTVILYQQEQRLTVPQQERIVKELGRAHTAMRAARAALSAGDEKTANDNLALVNATLRVLRGILAEVK